MREALLEAYWDVVRDGLGFKEAADRRGVNRGELYRICKTSIIPRPVGRPAAFDEFEEFSSTDERVPTQHRGINYLIQAGVFCFSRFTFAAR